MLLLCPSTISHLPVIISHSPSVNQNEPAILVSLGKHPTPPTCPRVIIDTRKSAAPAMT